MFKKPLGACVGLAMMGMAATGNATLIKEYEYTGGLFLLAGGDFTTSDNVSGRFTVDCSLASPAGDCASLSYADYASAATDYSFIAGPVTLHPSNSSPDNLEFSTSSTMDILQWNINLLGGTERIGTTPGLDFGIDSKGGAAGPNGSWTVATVSVPEPSALALLSIGFAGLGITRHRMKT
jgi:hypothetical protein